MSLSLRNCQPWRIRTNPKQPWQNGTVKTVPYESQEKLCVYRKASPCGSARRGREISLRMLAGESANLPEQ